MSEMADMSQDKCLGREKCWLWILCFNQLLVWPGMCLVILYHLNTFDDGSSSFVSLSRVWTCVWSTRTASATMESPAIATLTPHLILQSTWATTCLQSLCTASTDLKWRTLSVEIKRRMKEWFNCEAQHLAMISRKYVIFYIDPLLLCHLAFFHIFIHIDALKGNAWNSQPSFQQKLKASPLFF